MQLSLSKSSKQSAEYFIPTHPSPGNKIRRMFALLITLVIILLFSYHLLSEQGVLHVKEITVSGNAHYTQAEVITASGLIPNWDNIHKISVDTVEEQIKKSLRYVKEVNVRRHLVKRTLEINIIESESFAQIKYNPNDRARFVLVDLEGYVLEYIHSSQTSDAIVTIIGSGERLPPLGSLISSDNVQSALRVLNAAVTFSEIISRLHTIDANHPDKITLQLTNLPIIWLASDLIETGLHHIELLLRDQKAGKPKGKWNTRHRKHGYLDARFEDAIYHGGK